MTSSKSVEGRLIILAGPSCVGKSPLAKALAKFHPELSKTLQPVVLYNNREARPGETEGVDYYFRTRKYIENLKEKDHFVVMEVRGDIQALDLRELSQSLSNGNVFFEGNPFIGRVLLTHPALTYVNKLSMFMSPLTRKEILEFTSAKNSLSLPEVVTDIMRQKLIRRTQKQKGNLIKKDLEDIEKRASSAYTELRDAHLYRYVIPNHDGEDSENWNAANYPIGDARLALNAFVALLNNEAPLGIEKWAKELVNK
jgi:guanylate kinase